MRLPLPKHPLLDWSSFAGPRTAGLPSIADLPHTCPTTSGRAAIFQALRHAALPQGTKVLVPTFHCPTMIAPVVAAGLHPEFYPLAANGLPALDRITAAQGKEAGALLAPHYFGLTQSFAALRNWCDDTSTLLIEDCAHAHFGRAGERPVGAWGDYATASQTKFFPVLEGGLLASATRQLQSLHLPRQSAFAELKAAYDILQMSAEHGRMRGVGILISATRLARRARQPASPAATTPPASPTSESMMRDCDMARCDSAPLGSTQWLTRNLPLGNSVSRRREHFRAIAAALAGQPGAHPLCPELPPDTAPYAFPLYVEEADRVYHALRLAGAAVFRWDRIWPGTPRLAGDHGAIWSQHVLQLLCHQSLTPAEIRWTIDTLQRILREP